MNSHNQLDQLLKRNYDALRDAECEAQVVNYLREQSTLLGEDPHFIKRLTKVASHILAKNPAALEGLVEKTYTFHIEGMKALEEHPEAATRRNQIMHAHLSGHAATFADYLVRTMRDTNAQRHWNIKKYEHHKFSADFELSLDDLQGAMHNYLGAAHAAIDLAKNYACDNQEKKQWGEAALQMLDSALPLIPADNVPKKAEAYYSRATILHALYRTFKEEISFEENAIEAWGEAAEYAARYDSLYAAQLYLRAGNEAYGLRLKFTRGSKPNKRWSERSFRMYKLAERHCPENNFEMAGEINKRIHSMELEKSSKDKPLFLKGKRVKRKSNFY